MSAVRLRWQSCCVVLSRVRHGVLVHKKVIVQELHKLRVCIWAKGGGHTMVVWCSSRVSREQGGRSVKALPGRSQRDSKQ